MIPPAEIDEMRREYSAGFSHSAIARGHGISETLVGKLLRGETQQPGHYMRHHYSPLTVYERQRLLAWRAVR